MCNPPTDDVAERELSRLTSHIIQAWRRRLRRLADDRPRSGDRGEAEQLLVAGLLRASFTAGDETLPALAAAAARYGAGQRRDRLDPGGLCAELALLREIVWNHLKASELVVQEALDRILRFDRALSIVVKAAVSAGYSRDVVAGAARCADEPIESAATVGRLVPPPDA